jgi:hypothetical protein
MLFIAITSLLTIVISKKIYDFFCHMEMGNVYLTLGIYGLKAYTYAYIVLYKISNFLTFTNNTVVITFIKDGIEVKHCTLDQFKLHIDTVSTYDLVLYKEKLLTSDKYKYNVLRLNKHSIITSDFTYNISNIRFIDIQIIYKSIKYSIDFSKDNYYIVGNILFDIVFIKWYLKRAYGVILEDTENYTCTIMDQDINFIYLDSSNKIIIEREGYRIDKHIL